MKIRLSVSFSVSMIFVFFLLFLVTEVSAAPTQGYSECVEACFLKECGEVGIRCPTVEQKRIYRRKCHGYCREQMRRQEEERYLAAYRRRINLFQMRANEHRKMLILQHRMWIAKKKLLHKIKMEYEAAKRANLPKKNQILHRMEKTMDEEMNIENKKLQYKERFYQTRQQIRSEQQKELKRQVKRLNKGLKQANNQHKKEQTVKIKKALKKKQIQIKKVQKKEALLRVSYYETRVKRHEQSSKHIEIKKKRILRDKKTAEQTKNHKRLMALAKRLGALAGKQAALKRKTQVEKKKLKNAKSVLASYKGSQSDIH